MPPFCRTSSLIDWASSTRVLSRRISSRTMSERWRWRSRRRSTSIRCGSVQCERRSNNNRKGEVWSGVSLNFSRDLVPPPGFRPAVGVDRRLLPKVQVCVTVTDKKAMFGSLYLMVGWMVRILLVRTRSSVSGV